MSGRGPTLRFAVVFGMIGLTAAAATARSESPLREQLRRRLESGDPAGLVADHDPVLCAVTLPRFYEQRGFEPAWCDGPAAFARMDSLLQFLPEVATDGLVPDHYHLDHLRRLRSRLAAAGTGRAPVGLRADAELLLTDTWLLLATHLLSGRVDPETIDPEWQANRRGGDTAALLENALRDGTVVGSLRGLRPPQAGYRRLREALTAHRSLAAEGGWPSVPPGPTLHPGDAGPRVADLRARLAVTDGAAGAAGPEEAGKFDDALRDAVVRFQRRHGLEPDGVVGPATMAALNVTAAERVTVIGANLERWRWLPQDLGRRHILVNIADQRLELRDGDRVVLDMAVIVGRSYRRTPVFTGQMTYLVFSPSWEVPPKLAAQDKLPDLRSDPGRLAAQGFQALSGWGGDAREIDLLGVDWKRVPDGTFPYRLRQKPGPLNALGQVKFMFPNKHNVYLHDTPSRDLFGKASRTFSSGCIRVEKPEELADALLVEQPAWTREAVRAAMEAGEERTVTLDRPLPVHLLYWTAWVAADGTVQFRADIYGRDGNLERALAEPAPTSP